MLLTARFPLIDMRPFAAAESIMDGRRLPARWAEDAEFVRGVGPLRRRRLGPLREWREERVYADFSRLVRFEPDALGTINRGRENVRAWALRRRAYAGTDPHYALFDFDVQVPFVRRPWSQLTLAGLTELTLAVMQARVTVAPPRNGPVLRSPLGSIGWRLTERFSVSTATPETMEAAINLIRCGGAWTRPVVGIECPGQRPALDVGLGVQRYDLGNGIEIIATWTPVGARFAWDVATFVFASEDSSRATRATLRALRIHTLRLASIKAFLHVLHVFTSPMYGYGRGDYPLALDRSAPFDRLQETLAFVFREIKRAEGANDSLLAIAMQAHSLFTSVEFADLEKQLAAARPQLLKKLHDLEEAERNRYLARAVVQALHDRSREIHFYAGGLSVSKYSITNSTVGVVGDDASVGSIEQADSIQKIVISGKGFDPFDLVADLTKLRTLLDRAKAGDVDRQGGSFLWEKGELDKALRAVTAAEAAARKSDSGGVSRALRSGGRWLFDLATQVGAAVAAAAISSAAGIGPRP